MPHPLKFFAGVCIIMFAFILARLMMGCTPAEPPNSPDIAQATENKCAVIVLRVDGGEESMCLNAREIENFFNGKCGP